MSYTDKSKEELLFELQKQKEDYKILLSEKKFIEESLKSSLALLNTSLESTADGILIVHNNGKISKWNQKFMEMWKLSEEILSNNNDSQIISLILNQLSEPEQFFDKINYLYNNPEETSYDRIEFLDGRIFERYSQPHKIDHKIIGRLWSFSDVTERNKVSKAFKETNQFNIQIINSVQEGIIVYDLDMKYQVWNPFMEKLTGIYSYEVLGKHPLEVFPFLKEKGLIENLERALKGEITYPVEFPFNITINGKSGWISDKRVQLVNTNGEIIGIISTVHDITETKKSLEKIKKIGKHYQALIEKAPDGVVLLNSKGYFTFVSTSAKKMLGYNVSEEITAHPDELTHPDDLPYVLSEFEKVLKDPLYTPTLQYRFADKIGNWKWLESTFSNLLSDPSVESIIINFRDIDERKLTEKILNDSKDKYHKLFSLMRIMGDTVPDMLWAKDLNKQFLFVNKSTCENYLNAKDTSEPIGKTPHFFAERNRNAHPENPNWHTFGELCEDSDELTLKEMKEMQFEEFGNINGKFIYLDVRKAPMFDTDGKLIGIVGSARDITERKHVEDELEESRAKYKGLSEASFEAIFLSENGICIEQNNMAENLFGYTSEEAIGKNGFDWILPEDREMVKEQMISEFEKPCQATAIRKDGTTFPCLLRGKMMHYKGRNVRVTSLTDITMRKKAEDELKLNEDRMKSFILSTSDWIWEVDENWNYCFCSDNIKEILGYSIDEMIGNCIFDFIPNEEKEQLKGQFKNIFETESPITDLEKWNIHKDGSKVCLLTNGFPIFNEYGKIIGYRGADKEITDRKLAEELLLKQNKELEAQYEQYMILNEELRQSNFDLEISKAKAEESDKLKTAFLQNMSHEIRTPLNGIIGFTNLLKSGSNSYEDIADFTDIIQKSAKRLIEIVNNVLEISKIQTGQIEVNYKSFSINSIISDLYDYFISEAKEKNLELNFHNYFENHNSNIYCDDNKLIQILSNLINNSIKFTNSGTIDFGYEIKYKNILFYVKDTGIGISEKYQKKIFDIFTQIDLSMTRGYEGAGLGLAICKGLVELLGGKIWVESEINIGTSFFFELPYMQSEQLEIIPEKNNIVYKNKNRVKILIADDDYISFKYLRTALKTFQVTVFYAENGESALELVKNIPDLDLILMDMRMPIMNGFEATKLIKQIRPDLPIIAQTAYAFYEERQQILSTGCDEFISKPIDKDKILKLIEKYLKIHI